MGGRLVTLPRLPGIGTLHHIQPHVGKRYFHLCLLRLPVHASVGTACACKVLLRLHACNAVGSKSYPWGRSSSALPARSDTRHALVYRWSSPDMPYALRSGCWQHLDAWPPGVCLQNDCGRRFHNAPVCALPHPSVHILSIACCSCYYRG